MSLGTPGRAIAEVDGVRRYASSRTRYKPVPLEERKYGINKPDVPGAVRFHGKWFVPLDVVPEKNRVMPETRPDSAAKGHRLKCRCHVCRRPGGRAWRHRQALAERRSDRDGA